MKVSDASLQTKICNLLQNKFFNILQVLFLLSHRRKKTDKPATGSLQTTTNKVGCNLDYNKQSGL